MEPAGAPWCDPRRGYGYAVGSALQAPMRQQQPRSDVLAGAAVSGGGGGGGVLKRSLGEMERWEQQRQVAMQHALYMRAVRPRTAAQSTLSSLDIGAVLGGARSPVAGFSGPSSSFGGLSPQPSSTLSSLTTASRMVMPAKQHPPLQTHLQRQMMAVPSAQPLAVEGWPATASELVLLQELEKQLLGDDDEAEAAGSACGSAVTNSQWGDTIQQLSSIPAASSPPLPLSSAVNNNITPMSLSPTNSSSSTTSSSASSSPPISSRPLLSEAAAAIADGNHATAATHLAVLKIAANPRGDAEQRLVAMMAGALSSRVGLARSAPSQHLADLCGSEQRAACQLLHDVSPCFGLALHGANLAILDAVADHRVIHLVDFDISAAQQFTLIKALADRRLPASSLKVTAVTDPSSPFTQSLTQALSATSERLKKIAHQAGLEFRFKTVSCRAAEIDASRLDCEPGEALAVNLAFALSRVPDESVSPANPRDELLRRVRSLCPRVVTLVEQELNTNTAPLAVRFSDACAHYGAVLESLDATLGRDSAERARAEAALANKVANAVGREGPDRVERCEVFGKWRARFGMAGFRPVALSLEIADRVKALLGPAARRGFDVKPDNGRLGVGWMGRIVTVASAWR